MPARTANKVKVYVRTRPTNQFAAEMIAIGRDNRVNRPAERFPLSIVCSAFPGDRYSSAGVGQRRG